MLDRFSNIRHFYTIFVVSTVRGIIYPVHCTRAAAVHICTFFGRSRSLALQYPNHFTSMVFFVRRHKSKTKNQLLPHKDGEKCAITMWEICDKEKSLSIRKVNTL